MTAISDLRIPALKGAVLSAALLLMAGTSPAQEDVPIVQPGAPGEDSSELTAEEATDLAGITYSAADVSFMQDMIIHHQQAVEMSALVSERTNRNELIDVAERIDKSQKDEIAFMKQWLRDRGEPAPEDPSAYDEMQRSHKMAGMASPEELEKLRQSDGRAFDELFLELMIEHHKGAIAMVEDLHDQAGTAADPTLFEFTNDIVNDQQTEIERMSAMLADFSPDPRVGLEAGFRDAGEAIENMALAAALPKPKGFYDPENPANLPPSARKDADDEEGDEDGEDDGEDGEDDEGESRAFLNFRNSDLAFAGDIAVAGNYHGFNIYNIADPDSPKHVSSVVCPGGQGDVSIAGDLLIMSVEQTRARLDCGLGGVAKKVSDERLLGLRIFDISNLKRPKQVGAVQTCRGSHTHTIVQRAGENGKLVVYNSGTAPVRPEEEMEGCSDEPPYADEKTALFRIDIVEIPVDNPGAARLVDSPAVFAGEDTLAGLWLGGRHGPGTQETRRTDHCHDITVFPEKDIAAGACSGNGVLFDITDPYDPKRIDEVVDTSFAYWHSATFNNDGTKVIFTDEWGGGARPRCRPKDPQTWGADAIYEINDGELEFGADYKMPAPQSEQENCVAHNGSIVPVPGRDIFVQAWYQGGVSVMDFTDVEHPQEIAFFDRGPIHEEELVLGGYWSTYWYAGRIFGSAIVRGLDVLSLKPSEHLSENEVAAARRAVDQSVFNPQQQFEVTWQPKPVVARAYIDQLRRSETLDQARADELTAALDRAETAIAAEGDAELADELRAFAASLSERAGGASGRSQQRLTALGDSLEAIAGRLR